MINNKFFLSRGHVGVALVGALALLGSAASSAQQHVEEGRVISSTPIRAANGMAGYSVTYEYGGRQYTTRTDTPPGDYIQLQVSPLGVMATSQADAEAMQAPPQGAMQAPAGAEPWRNVTPEQGVVLSGSSGGAVPAPAPVYSAPVYSAPPVVYAPAPVYAAPGYYGYPYASYPPIGLSLNLGYSSWRGGRGWR